MIDFGSMPSNEKKASHSEQDYAVGDRVKVNLHTGWIVEATIKAIIERTDGKRLQVGFGKDETRDCDCSSFVACGSARARVSETQGTNRSEVSLHLMNAHCQARENSVAHSWNMISKSSHKIPPRPSTVQTVAPSYAIARWS
jgi:hypothetical protein